MHHAPLGTIGSRVTGVDLADVTDDDVAALVTLLAGTGVVVAPDQDLDDGALTALLRRFGEPVFTAGETPVEGHPDLNVITNVGRDRPPRSVFHVDTTYVEQPPTYTALRAVEVPASGGQTVFSDQYRAWETLREQHPDLAALVADRQIEHALDGDPDAGTAAESAWHPAVLHHPVSGRAALYVSTPQRCRRVSGLPDDQAADVIARLYEHSTAEELLVRHSWAAGDVVMWDNRCVMHRADHDGVDGARTLHRGMVLADRVPAGAGG